MEEKVCGVGESSHITSGLYGSMGGLESAIQLRPLVFEKMCVDTRLEPHCVTCERFGAGGESGYFLSRSRARACERFGVSKDYSTCEPFAA